ncbi:MAG: TIGR04076 family protein [Candidatus Brocadiales bacterium]
MARRPKIKITITEQVRPAPCHRGHKIGQSFDFDTERGKLCPMIMHVLFPAIDILRYGGSFPWSDNPHKAAFACPDPKTLLVFEIERVEG